MCCCLGCWSVDSNDSMGLVCVCVCVCHVCVELNWDDMVLHPHCVVLNIYMETSENTNSSSNSKHFIEIIRHQHVATMFIPRSDLQVTEGSAAGNIAIVLQQFSIHGVPDWTTLADMKQSLRLSTVDNFIISML